MAAEHEKKCHDILKRVYFFCTRYCKNNGKLPKYQKSLIKFTTCSFTLNAALFFSKNQNIVVYISTFTIIEYIQLTTILKLILSQEIFFKTSDEKVPPNNYGLVRGAHQDKPPV